MSSGGNEDRDMVAAQVGAACAGDREAMGWLYRHFAPAVHGVLLANGAADVVGDLVQETFLHAMDRLATLRAPGSFGPWLLTIARNRARNSRRTPRPATLDGVELPARSGGTTEAREILAEIRNLPEAYVEPLVLRLVEGMTGPEIAERTGMTPGSVRVNLHRGLKQLRERLTARGIHV